MKNLPKQILKTIVIVFCLILTHGYGKGVLHYLNLFNEQEYRLSAFLIGAGIYWVIKLAFFSKKKNFLSVLTHEFSHLIFVMLSFRKIDAFSAERGGKSSTKMNSDNFLIVLAPYFFPLIALLLIVVKVSVLPMHQWVLNGFLGSAVMFHFYHLINEFTLKQPDLQRYGIVFSLIVIVTFNLFFFGLCLSSLGGDWQVVGEYLRSGLNECWGFVDNAVQVVLHTSFTPFV